VGLRGLTLATLLTLLLACLAPGAVAMAQAQSAPSAQPGAVVAEHTEHFTFELETDPATAAAFAATYGPLAEQSLDELSTIFAVKPSGPIQIIGYADAATYAAATRAIGRFEPPGTDAIANPAQRSIAVSLPLFRTLSSTEAENAIRHALAHVLIYIASNGNAPLGFDEGAAEYVSRPATPDLARIAALMQGANQSNNLISWGELNRGQPPSYSPDLIGAESYSIVAYLVDDYSLRTFRDFLKSMHNQSDWRVAMRAVYNRGPDELEQNWQSNLPRWINGDWQNNIVVAFDLQPARDYLAKADYQGAKALLDQSQQLFTDLGDQAQLASVDRLLALCDTGIQAEALMTQVQQALQQHTYDRAASLLAQAQSQYAQLPANQRPTDLIATYGRLAQGGMTATQQLDSAQVHAQSWSDYREARADALAAGTTFAQLGDGEMVQRSQTLLNDLDTRQRRLVYLLGALASLTVGWLILWVWTHGPSRLDWK